MVGTILPIVYGERSEDGHSMSITVYVLGSTLGGAAVGWVAAKAGVFVSGAAIHDGVEFEQLMALIIFNLVLSARELRLIRVALPQSTWQVPRRWSVMMSGPLAALAYGVALGTGVLIRINSNTFYGMLLLLAILGRPGAGFGIGALYGASRAIPLILLASISKDYPAALQLHADSAEWHRLSAVAGGLILAAAAGAFGSSLVMMR